MHAERPDLLDRSARDEHDRELAHRVLGNGDAMPWLTLPLAITQLEELLATSTGGETVLLREHEALLRDRHTRARARLRIAS